MITKRKNEYDDFGILTDYENLYKAHKSCKSGKIWKDSVASYDLRAAEATLYLKYLLDTGRYKISEYHCFEINERGKQREIKSTKYHDRVVQKSLHENILAPRIMPMLCYENGASQPNKGTDFQLELLKLHMQEHTRKRGTTGFILIGDFKGYFDSINHEMVNAMYAREFKDERILKLIRDIHASIPGGVGVPLGNQLSQDDAILAASPLDHMVKQRLKIRGYGRYMDDFYLIHEDKEYLRYCLKEIEKKVAELGLTLNTKKTKIVPITTGINFLGFHYYVTKTGKVVMRIKAKSKSRERKRLRKFKAKVEAGEMTFENAFFSYGSWRAHAARGDTYYMLQEMDYYFYSLFEKHLSAAQKKRYEELKKQHNKREARRKKRNGKTVKHTARGCESQGHRHDIQRKADCIQGA